METGYAIVNSSYTKIDDTIYLNSNDAIRAVNEYVMNQGFNRSEIHIQYGYTVSDSKYITEDEDRHWAINYISEKLNDLSGRYHLKHIPKELYQKKKKDLTNKLKLASAGKLLWDDVL